jgi:hypothetical protein
MLDYTNRELEGLIDQLRSRIGKLEDRHDNLNHELCELRAEVQDELKRLTHNEAREHSSFVPGLGILRIRGAICGSCGRALQPYDFSGGPRDTWRATCSSCHTVVLETELPSEDRAA